MTFDNDDIDDLAIFASEHDDELWGAEPTRPNRPSSLRPPAMDPMHRAILATRQPRPARLTYAVGLSIAATAAISATVVWLCFG